MNELMSDRLENMLVNCVKEGKVIFELLSPLDLMEIAFMLKSGEISGFDQFKVETLLTELGSMQFAAEPICNIYVSIDKKLEEYSSRDEVVAAKKMCQDYRGNLE